jgi:hypothetical protein
VACRFELAAINLCRQRQSGGRSDPWNCCKTLADWVSLVSCSQARIDRIKLPIQLIDALTQLSQCDLGGIGYVGFGNLLQQRLDPSSIHPARAAEWLDQAAAALS